MTRGNKELLKHSAQKASFPLKTKELANPLSLVTTGISRSLSGIDGSAVG